MRILFAIFVLSLCALLWPTFAMMRRIRREKLERRTTTDSPRTD